MDIIRLRTMARKSVFDLGKFEGLSIQQILTLGHGYYVRFVYFKYDKISFQEDILEEVGITKEFRIEKPGHDLEMLEKCKTHFYSLESKGIEGVKNYSIKQKKKRIKLHNLQRRINTCSSKYRLKAKNEGNFRK